MGLAGPRNILVRSARFRFHNVKFVLPLVVGRYRYRYIDNGLGVANCYLLSISSFVTKHVRVLSEAGGHS